MIPFLKECRWPGSAVRNRKLQLALLPVPRGLMRSALFIPALALFCLPTLGQTPATAGTVPSAPNVSPGRHAAQRRTVAAAPLPSLSEVPATAAVATLNGVCRPAEKASNKDCKTVLPRAEMDRIVTLLTAGAPHASPQQIAVNYVRILAAASIAEERHLEAEPTVAKDLQGLERFPRQQVLARAFYKQVEEQAASPTAAEMQKYYADHQQQFEEGEVWRLSIPKSSVARGGTRTDPAELKAALDGLHRQALLGYDFDQIQLQAFKDLNISQVPPATRLTAARRSSMPPDQARVFDLQPGEVSEVIDSYTSFVILKLVAKRSAPFESVEPEIRADLRLAQVENELREASERVTAEFNLKYIGMSVQPPLFPVSGPMSFFSPSSTPVRDSSHPHPPTTVTSPPTQPKSNP